MNIGRGGKMKHLKLYWVNKFRDLINSKRSDKAIIKEFLMWGIKQEQELTEEWKSVSE